MKQALRLLCITAHPDDESGAFGGALMLAHEAGAETSVLCFTDGQAAHFRGAAAGDAELGAMRREEMAAACAVLGVTRFEVLHFPDGALAEQDFRTMTGVAVEYIRRWRPHIVLTFGGDGGVNLHRDHTVVSAVATMAFHWAGRAEMFPSDAAAWCAQKLYYANTPFVSVRDRPELADSAATTPWSLTLELGSLGGRKMEAFSKHASQHGVLQRVGEQVKRVMQTERYLLAAQRRRTSVTGDEQMFAGIDQSEA
jgi:LmbE family N-acetylglucosaminyl deacetylase